MTEQQENIMQAVRDLGGTTEWNPLKERIDYRYHQNILSDVRALSQEGKLKRQVKRDQATGRMVFTISIVGG